MTEVGADALRGDNCHRCQTSTAPLALAPSLERMTQPSRPAAKDPDDSMVSPFVVDVCWVGAGGVTDSL